MPRTTQPQEPPAPDVSGEVSDDLLEAGLAAAFGGPTPAAPAPETPDGCGRYEVRGEIARGGMGAVLQARDPDLDRDVAVKVLLARHRDDPTLRQRFLAEARVGGRLQHPAIVPVYELARSADGRPFFAMKLVEGRTLGERLAERPDPSHELPRFVHVFEQVCQAVAYAHSRGVIHRDLKPVNVMVGAFGEVQVMDWGLAKVLASRERQRPEDDPEAGTVLGTFAFMPPEQARGEADRLDERADVFGLGAILCVVLTGSPPYTGTPAELHRRAAGADLADALARLRGCGADPELVALAVRCLSADPGERPRDAGEVALAVAAHREGVERRLRAAELAGAEARARAEGERKRQRLTLALAASVLALAVLGGAVYLHAAQRWLRRTAGAERTLTELTALLGEARRAPANDPLPWERSAAAARRLRELLDTGEVLAATRDAAEPLLLQAEGEASAAARDRAMLSRLAFIRSDVRTELKDDRFDTESAAAEYAASFRDYGIDPGQPDETAERIRSSAIRVALLAALDDWALEQADAALRSRLAEVARRAEPDPEAWPARLRAALARDDRAALKALAGVDVTPVPASTLARWGRALSRAGDHAEAEAVLRAAHRLHPGDYWLNQELSECLRAVPGGKPDEVVRFATAALAAQPDSAAAHNNLGAALDFAGRPAEALESFRSAVRLRPAYGRAHANRGIVLQRLDRDDEAADAYREALRHAPNNTTALSRLLALLKKQGRTDAMLAAYREVIPRLPDAAPAFNNLGVLLWEEGRLDDAEAAYREALRLRPDYALARANLAAVLGRRGKHADALPLLREAVRQRPEFADFWYNLGNSHFELKHWADAEEAYRRCLQLRPGFARAHVNLGNALRRLNRDAEALDCYREALRHKPGDAMAQANVGNVLEKRGDLDGAEAAYHAALRCDPAYALAHNGLGVVHRRRQNWKAAEAAHREAIRLQPDLALAHNHLGFVLEKLGRLGEAEAEQREAIRLDPRAGALHNHLANVLRAQGKHAEAEAAYRDAARLAPDVYEPTHNLALLLRETGRADEALPLLREAAARWPQLGKAHHHLGVALEDAGDVPGAIAEYREAVRLDPEPRRALALGNALWRGGDGPGAEAAYREAIRLRPDYSLAHQNLAVVLKNLKRPEEALAALRRAHETAGPNEKAALAEKVREAERPQD